MYCFVSGCPNANDGSKESKKARMVQIFFSAPEDESLFKSWQSAVPKGEKVFSREDKLCDFHFKKSEVVLFNETKLPNGNVRRVPASEPKLKAGTIPSIFPSIKVSSNDDSKRSGTLPKTSNSEGQKSKQKRKLSSSDDSDDESPPPTPRPRGRPRKTPTGNQEKKIKTAAFDKRGRKSLMQPSIRLVPISSLLAPSPRPSKKGAAKLAQRKTSVGPAKKVAEDKKKTKGKNTAGPSNAKKKVKFVEGESHTVVKNDTHNKSFPVKPTQTRKQVRQDLRRLNEELQNAIDDINEDYEIEHITDPGDTALQDVDEIFEIMSIKSDPDEFEHKKTLEELAAELAESGQVADPQNSNASEADTMQEPRITQVISLRDLDEDGNPLLDKIIEEEPLTEDQDIEREMAKMLGEESVSSPEPPPLEKSETTTLPANDVSETPIREELSTTKISADSEEPLISKTNVTEIPGSKETVVEGTPPDSGKPLTAKDKTLPEISGSKEKLTEETSPDSGESLTLKDNTLPDISVGIEPSAPKDNVVPEIPLSKETVVEGTSPDSGNPLAAKDNTLPEVSSSKEILPEETPPDSGESLAPEENALPEISRNDETVNKDPLSEADANKESSSSNLPKEQSSEVISKENLDTLVLSDKDETVKETPIMLSDNEDIMTEPNKSKSPDNEESLPADDNIISLSNNEESSVRKDGIDSETTGKEDQFSLKDNSDLAVAEEPPRAEAVPETSVEKTTSDKICSNAENSGDKTSSEEALLSENMPTREEASISEVPAPKQSQKAEVNSKKKMLHKAVPKNPLAQKRKKKSNKKTPVRGRKRMKKNRGRTPSDDEILSPSSPEYVLDISSDSEADPTWAPNADAIEVSDDNDTDPECIGVEGESVPGKNIDPGTKTIPASKTSSEVTSITEGSESNMSASTGNVPPEVSRILTQDTLQQILKTLKLPLNAPVSFNIDGATTDGLALPSASRKTKEKPISSRGKYSKTHNENTPGRKHRRVQISVEKSKRCEKLLGVKMFEGLGKIKKAFDFSTFLTDADDDLQFKKFCLIVRECLRDVCESKNAVTNIGKLTLNISCKTMKSTTPVPDLVPMSKGKDTVEPTASKKDTQDSTGDEAEMFECMTVDSNVENHYENSPGIENAMEEEVPA